MTLLDAQQVGRSYDCSVPGCTGEARAAGGLCGWHQRNGTPAQIGGGRGALAHLMNDDSEPKEMPVSACKIDGCTEAGLDKRGPYTGLCSRHKREKAAAMGAARRTTVKPPPLDGPPAQTPAAPVAAKPAPAAANGHQEPTLVQLAQAVEDTRRAAADALTAHYAAKDALLAAVAEMEAVA